MAESMSVASSSVVVISALVSLWAATAPPQQSPQQSGSLEAPLKSLFSGSESPLLPLIDETVPASAEFPDDDEEKSDNDDENMHEEAEDWLE